MTQKTTQNAKAIFTLGWYNYEIDLRDAQALLEILNNARKLDRRYSDGRKEHYYVSEGKPEIRIGFLDAEVFDRDPEEQPELAIAQ